MSNLLKEIEEHFMTSSKGARRLTGFEGDYNTITIKHQEYYGVGVLNINNHVVNESFANVRLENKIYNINGEELPFLVLSSSLHEHSVNFARICEDFVSLGTDDSKRILVTTNPYKWWESWKDLLGNKKVDKKPYAVIAEMWTFKQELIKGHKNVIWIGPKGANHDIEGDEYHIEVKSSNSQTENSVTISNQFQLDSEGDLYLYLLKWKESLDGITINDLVEDLTKLGQDYDEIEMHLSGLNYPLGNSKREEKYRLVEGRSYIINDEFPRINAESFKGDKIPTHVKQIKYTVDLSSFEYDTIDFK